VTKLRPAGRIRPAEQFNPTRQNTLHSFSFTTFPTVDSSATAMAAACIKQKCKQNSVILLLLLYYSIFYQPIFA